MRLSCRLSVADNSGSSFDSQAPPTIEYNHCKYGLPRTATTACSGGSSDDVPRHDACDAEDWL